MQDFICIYVCVCTYVRVYMVVFIYVGLCVRGRACVFAFLRGVFAGTRMHACIRVYSCMSMDVNVSYLDKYTCCLFSSPRQLEHTLLFV